MYKPPPPTPTPGLSSCLQTPMSDSLFDTFSQLPNKCLKSNSPLSLPAANLLYVQGATALPVKGTHS